MLTNYYIQNGPLKLYVLTLKENENTLTYSVYTNIFVANTYFM